MLARQAGSEYGPSHQFLQLTPKRADIASKAGDYRRHKSLTVDSLEVERVASTAPQKVHKGQLASAVSLAKRMDSIEFSQKICGRIQEIRRARAGL